MVRIRPMHRIRIIRPVSLTLPIPGRTMANARVNIALSMPNPHRIDRNTLGIMAARSMRNRRANIHVQATQKPAVMHIRQGAAYALRIVPPAIAGRVGDDNICN